MASRDPIVALRDAAPAILPSLLMCDFANLAAEVRRLESAGVVALHLDVMDGSFVANLTYGMPVVAALREITDLILDVHLMIQRPGDFIAEFRDAGADIITFHAEADGSPREILAEIRSLGAAAGIALNPQTPVDDIVSVLDLCDLALVMSVPAGFGGQTFDRSVLRKLEWLRQQTADQLVLEVDGGVNTNTAGDCVRAGAHAVVAGSAILGKNDYTDAVGALRDSAMATEK